MVAYVAINNNEVDPDSPLTTGLVTRLRDNPLAIIENDATAPEIEGAAIRAQTVGTAQITPLAITNARIALNAVSQDKLQNDCIGQLELKTGTGIVSLISSVGAALLILPGGQYGFYPTIQKTSGVLNANVNMFLASSAALQSWVYINHGLGLGTTHVNQRYVIASPPHDLGDGPIPFFCFALVDNNGDVVALYNSAEPPWMYNGPTKTTPDYRDGNGVGYAIQRKVTGGLQNGVIEEVHLQVNADLKRADMNLIPHPFINMDLTGLTPVLLDPVGTERLLDLHTAGEDITKIITDGHLLIDEDLTGVRAGPSGVAISNVKWKS